MPQHASLYRRFAAALYELLSLFAIWLLIAAIYVWLVGPVHSPSQRFGLQLLLWSITGAYFILCWVSSGQTLATQAWKIKVVSQSGQALSVKEASLRYVFASLSFLFFGLGYLWAFVDKERLFMHDRMLSTRMVHNPQAQ